MTSFKVPCILRSGFISALLLTAIAGLPTAYAAAAEPVRPNIVFILVDDLGKEWISAYGAEGIQTPNIDRMARQGLRFNNAYAMPQCTPSRVTLLTGQYPFRHGWVNHWDVPRWGSGVHFDPTVNTSLPAVLRAAGYATAAAGKWQIDDFRVEPRAMEQAGFDDWAMWTGYEEGNPPSAERYWNPYIHTRQGSKTYTGEFGPDLYAQFLLDFIARPRDRPFFAYYAMALPHTPFTTTPDDRAASTDMDKHRAMVRYVDKLVGRFLTAAGQTKAGRPTVIVLTTDNGTVSITGRRDGRELTGGKTKQDEQTGTAMPFIAWGPGLVPVGVTDALVDFSDILPTFAELAGTTVPSGPDRQLDGKSFAPLLLGRAKDSARSWILSMGGHPAVIRAGRVHPRVPFANRVIRDQRWKLWVGEDRAPQRLFDLIADPFETVDLIKSDRVDAIRARERLWQIIAAQPSRDGSPRYVPNPPQPWDLEPDWQKR
jgi:arylsulfatase A-like enzyme